MPKIFKVNNYITLKLENKETFIYINNEKFKQCKKVILKIYSQQHNNNTSIDELLYGTVYDVTSEDLFHSPIITNQTNKLDPETEFWAHCSNIQGWADQNYDTRFLNSTLSFPMLKKLTELGDSTAKKIFKEEIAKRFLSGYSPVIKFLILENYLNFLNQEEKKFLLDNLKSIDLSNLSLTYIPDFLFEAIKLEKFYLHNNYIKEIDERIESIKDLIELDLNSNRIEKISYSIKNLKSLKVLKLANNKIKSIPNSFCSNLEELDLRSNKIKQLPNSLGQISNLKTLKLTNNNLKCLPESIKNMKRLQFLDLSQNSFKIFPKSLCKINTLKYLYLNNNKIQKIPESINSLYKLNDLNLNMNAIKVLPPIFKLKNLRNLYIENNKIHHLPKFISNLTKMESLSISGNPIKEIPETIGKLPKLKYFKISKTMLLTKDLKNNLKNNGVKIFIE